MIKRMTLLAKRQDLSTSDFRSYWAGPHAKLALGMEGIAKYVQNRVDKVLWSSDATPAFSIDGIVELYFEDDDAMRRAQATTIGRRYIPADEPNFLRGWTLCVMEPDENYSPRRNTKVIVPFLLSDSLYASMRPICLIPTLGAPFCRQFYFLHSPRLASKYEQ